VLSIASPRLRPFWLSLLLFVNAAVSMSGGSATAHRSDLVRSVALRSGLGRMAEVDIAIDPRDSTHLVAAADPYGDPVRIVISESHDGGKTWDVGPVVAPPGFAKSYDPTVEFDQRGDVIVVGGASDEGEPDCQPRSAVFHARVHGDGVTYDLIQPPQPDTYFDRPAMTHDEERGRTYVTWTRSSGEGAECLATPLGSTTMFAHSGVDGTSAQPTALPSTGLPAPFGSSLAVDERGRLYVSVAERIPGAALRVVLMWSDDEGRSFSKPHVVGENAELQSSVPGLGGFVASVPTVTTGRDGRVAVAWSSPTSQGSKVRVVERLPDGSLQSLSPRGRPGRYDLFPSVAYDPWGDLWLLAARQSGAYIRFVLRAREGTRWSSPSQVGAGPAAAYAEVGQFLGLSAEGETVAVAAPVNGERASFLRILVHRREARVGTGTSPRTQTRRATRDEAGSNDLVMAVVAIVGAAVAAAFLLRRRHR
jgi:hypothetical protein